MSPPHESKNISISDTVAVSPFVPAQVPGMNRAVTCADMTKSTAVHERAQPCIRTANSVAQEGSEIGLQPGNIAQVKAGVEALSDRRGRTSGGEVTGGCAT